MDSSERSTHDTPPAAPAADELFDGRYILDDLLATGGMGEVFAARHAVTGRAIALKRLFPHIAIDAAAVARFEAEARIASSIGHPDIVEVIDAGRSDAGDCYIVMEHLDGRPFDDWLEDEGRDVEAGLALIRAICEPVGAAHAANIVHRDLKPENVFVVEGGVKVLDFGIARDLSATSKTKTGVTMGTPHYMSPEQAMDPRRCTAASDVWSLGVMMYQVVAGFRPFEGETFPAVCMQAIQSPHPPLSGRHPALIELIDRCLAKDPADRPADARALGAEFDLLPAAARSGALYLAQPASRRWPLGVGLVAGLIGVLLIGLAIWRSVQTPAAPAEGLGDSAARLGVQADPVVRTTPEASPSTPTNAGAPRAVGAAPKLARPRSTDGAGQPEAASRPREEQVSNAAPSERAERRAGPRASARERSRRAARAGRSNTERRKRSNTERRTLRRRASAEPRDAIGSQQEPAGDPASSRAEPTATLTAPDAPNAEPAPADDIAGTPPETATREPAPVAGVVEVSAQAREREGTDQPDDERRDVAPSAGKPTAEPAAKPESDAPPFITF